MGTPNVTVARPEVVLLTEYNGFIFKSVNLNRRNVYIRDGGICQYCGCKPNIYKEMNIDHVIPSARGGKTTWKNVALSCIDCNQKKGCRTPEEAGMKLRRKPFVPRWYHMHSKQMSETLKNWESLFGEIYWNVELKD